MAIAPIAQTTGSGVNGGTSGTIDSSNATLLIANIGSGLGLAGTLTDSKNNTWHLITNPTTNVVNEALYYAYENLSVGTNHSITVTAVGGASSFEFAAFSGSLTASDPLDQTTYKPTSGTYSVNPGSIQTAAGVTPTTDGQLIIMGTAGNNTQAVTPGSFDSSMTRYSFVYFQSGDHYDSYLGYYVQSTAALINPTFTETSDGDADFESCTLASFKAASGGGGGTAAASTNKFLNLLGIGI